MDGLAIRYEPDPNDEVGKLWFEVGSGRFSGSGFFWSNLSEIPGLMESLRAFPLRERVHMKWGYDGAEGENTVLSLAFAPAGPTGRISVDVSVADLHDLQQRLTAKFETDYACLGRMLDELAALVQCECGRAALQAA